MNTIELQQQMRVFIQNDVKPCKKCMFLHNDKKISATFLIDVNEKPILVVGEAPGKVEYEKGCVFCGRSGQLLRGALKQAGYKSMILINAIKCRPPENRTPEDEEIQNCLPYLQEQIRMITEAIPGIKIIAAGRVAEKALKQLEIDHKFIYHPAFILRQGGNIESYAEIIRQALQEEEQATDENVNLPMLHVHTDYSVRDGILRIDNLIQICKEKQIPACVTDHGTMAGLYELEHKCIKDGID
ncbi:MAG TPA: uracil-DNA glycosylase family protein, partial [Spirochaetota bacterium]|nr:uracil-DNA glycosylase family protein [Spirochaetota bacterium]